MVALKRVNELDFYSLSHADLATKTGLTPPRTTALIRFLQIEDDAEYFKWISVGKVKFKRYSPKALDRLREALESVKYIGRGVARASTAPQASFGDLTFPLTSSLGPRRFQLFHAR